jgi:hypothetical protein
MEYYQKLLHKETTEVRETKLLFPPFSFARPMGSRPCEPTRPSETLSRNIWLSSDRNLQTLTKTYFSGEYDPSKYGYISNYSLSLFP